jgi:Tfp pilus assembly protein PilZ
MKKRNEQRLKKSLLAYTNKEDFELLGVISNISRNGIYIESSKNFDLGNEISFVLAIYDELYQLKGEIKWKKSSDDADTANISTGLGIRITEAPVEYLNYVEYIKYQLKNLTKPGH